MRTIAFIAGVDEEDGEVLVCLPSESKSSFWVDLDSIPFTPEEDMYYFVEAEVYTISSWEKGGFRADELEGFTLGDTKC